MAAVNAEYYFRFRICRYRCLQNVKMYDQTKLRRHISMNGWDLTTSVFEKKTSAILAFYFRFWFRPLPVIFMFFCITLPNFVQIGAPTAEIWKTKVSHIGNLLSVSISTTCPKSDHYSASGYRISFKKKHPLWKYDVISISQDGGRHR